MIRAVFRPAAAADVEDAWKWYEARRPGLGEGLLFGQPDRSYQSAELIRLARGGVGAVHRQLSRLVAADLVEVSRSGNQKHYRARRDSPVFAELHGLVVKTVALVEPIRRALAPHHLNWLT